MAKVCKVNGTGPKGTVIHAQTVMSAIPKPQKAMDFVRLALPAIFFISCSLTKDSFHSLFA